MNELEKHGIKVYLNNKIVHVEIGGTRYHIYNSIFRDLAHPTGDNILTTDGDYMETARQAVKYIRKKHEDTFKKR